MWTLEGGESNSQWPTWSGDGFIFCNPDGTPPDPSEYCSLADVINLVEITNIEGDPILSEEPHPPFDLWLVKNNTTAPAPEPTAIVLFGAGLLGMALKRKKRPGVQISAGNALLP